MKNVQKSEMYGPVNCLLARRLSVSSSAVNTGTNYRAGGARGGGIHILKIMQLVFQLQ